MPDRAEGGHSLGQASEMKALAQGADHGRRKRPEGLQLGGVGECGVESGGSVHHTCQKVAGTLSKKAFKLSFQVLQSHASGHPLWAPMACDSENSEPHRESS